MRLAYRILSMPVHRPTADDGDHVVDQAIADTRLAIAKYPILRFDNVARYVTESRMECDDLSSLPNLAPPFPAFFVEFENSPRIWSDGKWQPVPAGATGYFVQGIEARDLLPGGAKHVYVKDSQWWEKVSADIGGTKWILFVGHWLTFYAPPICGAPLFVNCTDSLLISPEGRFIEAYRSGTGADAVSDSGGTPMMIFAMGLSFMHCKNVVVQSAEEPHTGGAKWHRRFKKPILRFHTLDIDPMKRVLRHEGQSEATGLKRALHICRGHFSHYSPEAPMFGKLVGTFWVPDHVRGTIDEGEVRKNYNVAVHAP